MKKLWTVLFAMMLAAGSALAAGDEPKSPPPAPPPALTTSPQPPPPPPPPDAPREMDPARIQERIQRNKEMLARWEEAAGKTRSDESKKILTDAVQKGKEIQTALQAISDALQAGKDDDARQAAAQMRDKQMDFMKYFALVPTCMDMDRVKAIQNERGKDNADLSAACDRILGLLSKKLDLQKQLAALDGDLIKERQALRQSGEGARGNPPGAERPAK